MKMIIFFLNSLPCSASNFDFKTLMSTLPELILAILMLAAFTGITVMVTAYISRFFQPLNEEAKEEYISNNFSLFSQL